MKPATRRRIKKFQFLKNRAEKILRRRQRVGTRSKNVNILEWDRRPNAQSSLLEYLNQKNFFPAKVNINSKEALIVIPEEFSFLDNPDESIQTLKYIYYYGTQSLCKSIFFDHSKCKNLGICASAAMDVISLEIRRVRKAMDRRFSYHGVLPDPGDVTDILQISGLLKHLGLRVPEKKSILKLDLQRSEDDGVVGTRVVEYFRQCLATQGFSLSPEGISAMSEMVTEVVNNCKIHSGPFKEWYALGHYVLRPERDYGECNLVILNFGNTIYESLKSPVTGPEMREALDRITSKHTGWFSRTWTSEALWTLYALQDGVSRFWSKEKPDRGTGTIKLVESFQAIGKNLDGDTPMMSITSGRVHILFDGTYTLQPKKFEGGDRQIIAFNQENDLYIPPDSRCVRLLKNKFPGTVISMKFYLDKNYLAKRVGNGGREI